MAEISWDAISTFIGERFTIVLLCLNFVVALTIIFLERRNPSATLAWIMILILLPVFGIIIYIFLGQNFTKAKMFRMSKSEQMVTTNSLLNQKKAMDEGTFDYASKEGAKWKDLVMFNHNYAAAYYTKDNEVEIFSDGREFFKKYVDDIRKAKKSIKVQYFIVKSDFFGKYILNELVEKAKEGVEVRFLMDALGSRTMTAGRLKEFEEAGGKYALFFPPRFKYLTLKLNYRNHRKVTIIDEKIGYTGGFNVAKEYIGKKKKFGYWRDTHLRIEGDAVNDLNIRFLLDWRFASHEKVDIEPVKLFKPDKVHKNEMGRGAAMQVISSGPDTAKQEIKAAFMKIIANAKKYIYIQTPYFVLDESLKDALTIAAHSGVDVKVMIPEISDHMFVKSANRAYAGDILEASGSVYVYRKGFLHAKMLVADDEVVTFGSSNFDKRSFKLNFETNVVVYDENVAKRARGLFEKDEKASEKIDYETFKERPNYYKMKESITILISDLL